MIDFKYEYEVIDTHNMGIYSLQERLKHYGDAGWIVNCSVGEKLILSRAKLSYAAPKSLMSKQEIQKYYDDVFSWADIEHEMNSDYNPCG